MKIEKVKIEITLSNLSFHVTMMWLNGSVTLISFKQLIMRVYNLIYSLIFHLILLVARCYGLQVHSYAHCRFWFLLIIE